MAKSFKRTRNNRRNLIMSFLVFALIGGAVILRASAAPNPVIGGAREYPASATAPQIQFSATSNSTVKGGSATLVWSSSGANICSAAADPGTSDWMGGLGLAGRKSVKISSQPTRYRMICELRRSQGGDISTAWHGIRTPGQVNASTPRFSLSASPAMVKKGQKVTLTWTSTGVSSCVLQNGYGIKWATKKDLPANGSNSGTISGNTIYYMQCADGIYKDTNTWNNQVMGMVEAIVQ